MFLIFFIGGVVGISGWLLKNVPPLYVWVCAITIIVGVIGLSFIPFYRRYKTRIAPPINKVELIRAIAEAKIAIDHYVEFIERLSQSYSSKDISKETAIRFEGKYKIILTEYEKALNSFEKEILIAGTDYEVFVKGLRIFMQMAPLHGTGKWKSKGQDSSYLSIIDSYVKETIKKINDISQ